MRKYKTIFVLILFFSSCLTIGIFTTAWASFLQPNNEVNEAENTISDDAVATTEAIILDSNSFYYDLGEIYNVKTSDNVNLKMLRYHPPKATCNVGGQPILLFSGIISNMNQFLMHSTTTLEKLYDIQLPENIDEWAKGDERIKEDPMLYYSLAYFLWKMGYDPYFVNYRGTGYGEMKSDRGKLETSLDIWAIYDVRASVRKVYEISGKHPIIGGHSTGGLVSYVYLQGCEFKTSIWTGATVVSNQRLADERNGVTEGPETVKGFIAIEPAMIAKLPAFLDALIFWAIIDPAIYLDIRLIIDDLLGLIFDDPVAFLVQLADALTKILGDSDLAQLMVDILNTDPDHMNSFLMDYLLRYTLDNTFTNALSQYMDWAFHKTAREHYDNGWHDHINPPTPSRYDGYYYYTKNMYKVKVPIICFLATHNGEFMDLVIADYVLQYLMAGKTKNQNDKVIIVDGAHIDVAMGTDTPTYVFPEIQSWLDIIV